MTDDASPVDPVLHRAAGNSAPTSTAPTSSAPANGSQARFEFLPGDEQEPATVRCAGDIDLTNAAEFQAALDQAAATASAVTADMTKVSYCDSAAIRALFRVASRARLTIRVNTAGPINGTLLEVSGLDQIATVVTLD